jgi:hypothetical protein
LSLQNRQSLHRCLCSYITETISFDQCASALCPIVQSILFLTDLRDILTTQLTAAPPAHARQHTRWTADEDRRLLAAIHRYGCTDWPTIAASIGNGRTKAQCAQRWRRSLDPAIRRDRWQPTEDALLALAVQRHGEHAWTRVSADMKCRSDVQCRGRWQTLKTRRVA